MKLVKVQHSKDDSVRQIIMISLGWNEVHQHGVEEMKVTLEQNCFSFPPLSLPLFFVLCCAIPQHLCVKREGSCKVLGLENIVAHKC